MESKTPFIPQLTEIAAFKSRILKIPAELYDARSMATDARRRVSGVQRDVAAVKEELAQLENEYVLTAAADRERFPNEQARKAEVRRRLVQDDEAVNLQGRIRNAEDELLKAQMRQGQADLDVQRLEDEQRALRIHTDLTCSEVQLLVAGR